MNILETLPLVETHFQDRSDHFYNHYREHVANNYDEYFRETTDEIFEPMTEDEYDNYAHELSQQPVYSSDYNDNHDVIGFVTTDGRILKFRKSLSDIVIYRADRWRQYTITYYKVNNNNQRNRYERLKNRDYLREIVPEDDYYNI